MNRLESQVHSQNRAGSGSCRISSVVRFNVFLLALLVLSACASTPVSTPTMSAVDGNDQTLFHSPCEKTLGRGVEVCRVVNASKITSSWRINIPITANHMGTASIRLRSGDRLLTFSTREDHIDIPWKDIVDSPVWMMDHDRPYQAAVTVKYDDGSVTRLLGHALILVLRIGYTPLNMSDSAPESYCVIKTDDVGRSAWECH